MPLIKSVLITCKSHDPGSFAHGTAHRLICLTRLCLIELQTKIDKGVADLAVMIETARRATEDREAALRDQINQALQKIRAYARDMEESLDQERLKLEEVVKMEIKARITSTDQLKEVMNNGMAALRTDLAAARGEIEQVKADVANKVLKEMRAELEAGMTTLASSINDLGLKLREEEQARVGGLQQLQKWFDQNQVDQKVAEEALHMEIDALSAVVEEQKQFLHEQLVEQVGGLRTDLDKLRGKVKAERKERESLAELVQVRQLDKRYNQGGVVCCGHLWALVGYVPSRPGGASQQEFVHWVLGPLLAVW